MLNGVDWYLHRPVNWIDRLADGVAQARDNAPNRKIRVCLRADDIAVPGRQLFSLLKLCISFEMPLALALVPAWTTLKRWDAIQKVAHLKPDLWCWHQHGWRHANHEPFGKKQEFGPSRTDRAIQADLDRGRSKLEKTLGDLFIPIFTPPWNRCDQRTLAHLVDRGYRAISRFSGNLPETPPNLPDLCVNVDLHTRREADPDQAWANLLGEFIAAFESGYCGIMLHHQRMSPAAFTFLEHLFQFVLHSINIEVMHFTDIIPYKTN